MARDFNGSTQYLNHGDPTAITPSLPMTVMGWIQPDTVAVGVGRIVSYSNSLNSGFSFGRNGSGLRFTKQAVADIDSTTLTLVAGVWQFIAASVDTTTVRLTIMRGSLQSQTVANASAFDNTPTPSEGSIGANLQGGVAANFLDGKIAHVGVFVGQALSDAAIAAFAFGDLASVGATPDFYVPLCGVGAPEPELVFGKTGALVAAPAFFAHPINPPCDTGLTDRYARHIGKGSAW